MAVFDIYLYILIISMNFTSYPVSCDDSINGDSVSWSEWTEWSRCNRPCPWSWCRNTTCIGAKTRRRTCTDSVTDNSTLICSGSFKQNVLCIKAVCPVKGEWSGWTEWSACSVTCGNGYRQRIRFCADRRKPCRGKNFEKANCNAELSCPSDGQFGEWGQWSECSQPCSGVRKRQRNCTYPKPRQGDKNCSGNWEETQNCSDVSCEAQSPTIRLIGGNSTTEGRVEVYYNGSWGTVCDDNFGDKDAAVVCHMLGFSRLNAKAKGSAFFGQGSGHIWMDEMGCTDSDTNLFRCSQNALGSHNCGHNEDAGVMCQTFSGLRPDIRLVGGSNAMEGRVEIFYNGEWGTVCDDAWDNNDAAVVCFMLGFSRKNATARTSAHFGQVDSRMRIWTDDVRCQGDEMDLLQCNKSSMGTHNCGHSEDAGVICSLDEAVRLVGGNTALEGRVEINHEGSWGTICDDGWGNEDAAVICSMLGFSRDSIAKGGGSYPNGVGPIFLDDVGCTGSERFISQCQHSGWNRHNCQHSEDAGVSCKFKKSSIEGCGNADILIVMDDSGSVGTDNFIKMKSFVKEVVQGLDVELFRFSVITFSATVTKKFGFADYVRLSDILSAVDSIAFRSGRSTQTDDALRYARQSIFNVKRPEAANIVILCTDGESTDPDETMEQAAQLRSQEVRIFAIGVGSGPDTVKLNAIASSPSSDHVFQVSSFTALPQILNAVQNKTCKASVDGGFSEWSSWTQCSRTCGSGTKTRSRTCTNPVPTNRGRNCTGAYAEIADCTIAGCPVDGHWSGWTAWGDCSVSCGGGSQQKNRYCSNPSPQNGGLPCLGTNTDTQTCNPSPCPIHGGFSS